MELRQLRYLVRVIELGSISRAALDMNLVQSALSQQISRLEGELSTRLLQRSPKVPQRRGWLFSARRNWCCAMRNKQRVRPSRRACRGVSAWEWPPPPPQCWVCR
jgi:hypothetical protein